jgi:hypothetical protein
VATNVSSEMLLYYHITTQHHNPEDLGLKEERVYLMADIGSLIRITTNFKVKSEYE